MTAWRGDFFREENLFAPIAVAARRLEAHRTFPSPEDIDAALAELAGVRFVRKSQRDRVPYDARIVHEGVVPTRAGSWHDLLNALVWATFPRAKRALHVRQHGLVVPSAPRRSPEGDALAMIDEGGVFCVGGAPGPVFGHAIYEARVLGRAAFAAGLDVPPGPEVEGDLDASAAAAIADRSLVRTPDDLARVALSSL